MSAKLDGWSNPPASFLTERWINLEPVKAVFAIGIGALALPFILLSLVFRRKSLEANNVRILQKWARWISFICVCLVALNFPTSFVESGVKSVENDGRHYGPCPALENCRRFEDGHASVHFRCLSRITDVAWWDRDVCDHCILFAALAQTERFHQYHGVNDASSTFVALVTGSIIDRCSFHDIVPWARLEKYMSSSLAESIEPLFQAFLGSNGTAPYEEFFGFAFDSLLQIDSDTPPLDVLLVGPFLYENEIVIAPSLHYPSRLLRVGAYILRQAFFPSSSVSMIHFPFALQRDVNIAVVHLCMTIRRLRTKFVTPSDCGGILMVSKLAKNVEEQCTHRPEQCDHFVLMALKHSITWPPVYPPPSLSKLILGHEQYAPQEEVVADSSQVEPDLHAALEAAKRLESHRLYLKREYSAGAEGVMEVAPSRRSIQKAFRKLLPRRDGVTMFDIELPYRLFLQKPLSDAHPLAVRFYARHGQLVAGHTSEVVNATRDYGVSYKTIRHYTSEQLTMRLMRSINFTGFGAAWYWRDSDGEPRLLDFNARMERNACLTPALSVNLQVLDACYLFQQLEAGKMKLTELDVPVFLPAGIGYYDAFRAHKWGLDKLEKLHQSKYFEWNLWREDEILFQHAMKVISDPAK